MIRQTLYDFYKQQNHALLAQWDSARNLPLTPAQVTCGSHKKVWWTCANGHHWQAVVYSRVGGSGCPYCTGRRRQPNDRLLSVCAPTLADEWDAEKNHSLQLAQITVGTHRKVWWRCDKGHSYSAAVNSRMRGSGCPYCTGRAVLPEENSLAATYPALVSEWDAAKNAYLTPAQVLAGSHRKVWWHCKNGHSWQATVSSRTQTGTGCPVCTGRKIIAGENDLASAFPRLAAQWDTAKNGSLTPKTVSPNSNRRVWWRCEKGHSYGAIIAHCTRSNSDCPYCTNRKVLPGFNDLATVKPQVAGQWHPTLNGSLTPEMVTAGSHRRVWWRCALGHV